MSLTFIRPVLAGIVLFLVVDVASSTGTVLAKSNLETCTGSSSGSGLASSDCALKLVVTYAVPTGQNATDALELVISSVEDSSSGQQLFADKQVTLVINKTPIYFYYPTTCKCVVAAGRGGAVVVAVVLRVLVVLHCMCGFWTFHSLHYPPRF